MPTLDFLDADAGNNKYDSQHLFAIVQHTVVYFNAGDFVAYDGMSEYMWDGADDDSFIPAGKEIEDRGRWGNKRELGVVLDKAAFAVSRNFVVVGNAIGGGTALQDEIDIAGDGVFDNDWADILALARELPKPNKKHRQYSTFLTVWKVVYDEYTTLEAMYPEYDMHLGLLGSLDLSELNWGPKSHD